MERKHTLVYGIKGKLISAVAMLLVAIIMVVSSTYAWFTLSTAPEVTGISTAIGANGALEIRLNGETIEGQVNTEYGNLVNLSVVNGTSIYGLDKIVLLPSKLQYAGENDTTTLHGSNLLAYPQYGEDGRPGALITDKVVEGTYDSVNGEFYPTEGASNGVSALGVASGLTDRQLAFRNAKGSALTNMGLAKTAARNSLTANGSDLATVVMKKATETAKNPATFTQEDLGYLNNIIEDLNDENGVLAYIEDAYKQQILAFAGSQAANVAAGYKADGTAEENATAIAKADAIFNYIKANIDTADNLSLAKIAENKGIVITLPTGTEGATGEQKIDLTSTAILAGIEAFVTTKANVALAANGITELSSSESISWNDLSSKVLNYILDYSKMTLNGYKASEVKENMSNLVSSVVGKGIKVEMADDAGVYVDIADHCGDYSAGITIKTISYNGMRLDNVPASMETKTSQTTAYLTQATNQVETAGEPVGTSTQKLPMSEFYGYVIDLAFKTNATGSDLLLQTEATDRIYSDNNNELTQGGGSSMTFKAVDASFNDTQVKALMSNIRIVFFNTKGRAVLAQARLDTQNAVADGEGAIKANMYLYNTVYKFTYGETDSLTTVYAEKATGATEYYSDNTCKTVATILEGTTLSEAEAVDVLITEKADSIIKALPQNEEVEISVLVYLDGENMSNADVAATGTQSVTGSMNLQFSSSANLTPMEYGDLHIKGEATETTAP